MLLTWLGPSRGHPFVKDFSNVPRIANAAMLPASVRFTFDTQIMAQH